MTSIAYHVGTYLYNINLQLCNNDDFKFLFKSVVYDLSIIIFLL